MNISQILAQKDSDATPAEKVTQLTEAMGAIRKKYGNAAYTIPMPDIDTAAGAIALCSLPAEDQIVIATSAVKRLKFRVVEMVRQNPALNGERVALELLATDSILANVGVTDVSEYL